MAAGGWAAVVVVVVVLTQIGAAPTTWTAPGLARVSRDTAVETGAGSCGCSEARLVAVVPLSFGVAGYGVQSMGRLRSDCEEFCEALGDMGSEDASSPSYPSLFK
jgi:hypothetical protein